MGAMEEVWRGAHKGAIISMLNENCLEKVSQKKKKKKRFHRVDKELS